MRGTRRLLGRRAGILALCALGAIAGSGGCAGGDEAPESPPARQFAFEETYGSGPVRLALRLEKSEIKLSDRVVLEQELLIEPGFAAEFPEYLPEDFDGFSVIAIEYPDGEPALQSEDTSKRRRYRKWLTLEPDRSGSLTIASLVVYFQETGKQEEHHFLTEELAVEVQGLESIDSFTVRAERGIFEEPPLEIEDPRLLWAAGGVGALALATLAYLWATRRERPPPPPPPAQEVAYAALRRLIAERLIERGEVELFFVHLSGILREYVENRFQVHAPERTTEEFLVEASRATAPELARHRGRLGEFLRLSDQVKFARYAPETAAIQASFDVVKQFIEETREDRA
jgi:hypothetical protein